MSQAEPVQAAPSPEGLSISLRETGPPSPVPGSATLETTRRPSTSAVRSRAWVGIAANRGAGQGKGRQRVSRLVHELRARGFRSRIAWTVEGRTQLVADATADPRAHCLVAVGGDGTVAALINDRPNVPMTVLPTGTENLFARHFGMTPDSTQLADAIVARHVRRIDLGEANGRRFALMAGIGFDADVVTRHHRARVRRTGLPRPTHRAAYVEPILRASLDYGFPMMTVRVADPGAEEELEGSTVFVFNLPRYALGLPFAPSAVADDGWLDLVVFQKPGPLNALHYLWLVLRGLHLKRRGISHRRVRRVEISASERVPVQLDGDPGGFIESDGSRWSIVALPQALEILTPSKP
ncbi:MAG: diacylglycerol kinase family protein [Isosphaeraceae bacterium]